MGYKKDFIPGIVVDLPVLSQTLSKQFKENGLRQEDYFLDYVNYSVLQNPFRRFPYYSVANIDGGLFIEVNRTDNWGKDDRIPSSHQFGEELYEAESSHFDRGHMTKREDVQWGKNRSEAKKAAKSTFYYTNAVPQMIGLNRSIWRRIENYILHSEGVGNKMKLIVFTGPVLHDQDPIFVTKIADEAIRLPRIFWKVVFYLNIDKEISRTAFLTNQSNLLNKNKIVQPTYKHTRSASDREHFFLDFKDADTYQTDVSVIESLTSLTFTKARDVYTENRIVRLLLEDVDIKSQRMPGEDDKQTIINLKL